MRTAQSVAQEMLERFGWFVLCVNDGRQHWPGDIVTKGIVGQLQGERVEGSVVIIGDASLEDLNMQAQIYGLPALPDVPYPCRIYRAVAE